MSDLKLFGSATSPYVRRVRIVAQELGLAIDWTDTTQPEGQRLLRDFNPLWKVPAAELAGEKLFDSSVIIQALFATFGPGDLALYDPMDRQALTTVNVIDGALDSLINAFYLCKEGVSAETPYIAKQRARAESALSWLDERVRGPWATTHEQFGLPEIALITALDWMSFRDAYPVERHRHLVACAEHHQVRASVRTTAPA